MNWTARSRMLVAALACVAVAASTLAYAQGFGWGGGRSSSVPLTVDHRVFHTHSDVNDFEPMAAHVLPPTRSGSARTLSSTP